MDVRPIRGACDILPDAPAERLRKDYALAMGVDLIVLGMHRRSKIAEIMTGSVAKSIVDDASCDVLIIPQKAGCGNRDVPS